MVSVNNNYIFNNVGLNGIKFRGARQIYLPPSFSANDNYQTNPLYDSFGNKSEIESIARANPRIREISKEYGIPIKVNDKELKNLKCGHLVGTRITAAKIYSNLPDAMKSTVDSEVLQEAAMFHDYGKILIPEDILSKEGALTADEWDIMKQHAEIGFELLKNKNLHPRALELIKYHHQTANGEGYPMNDSNYSYGLDSEILAVADKYEALREKRSYKDSLPPEEALNIIYEDVKSGAVSQEVFDALKKSV